ncbi:MAG: hypothetical protein ACQEP1_05935 [Nanobdellota archaeon]
MVDRNEFNKQFRNMGIDKESIMSDNKKKETDNKPREKQEEQKEEPQEMMLLKRKVDYLQNNVLKKIEEKINELDKKIEEKTSSNVDHNRNMTQLRNEVEDIKSKMNKARVTFGDEPAQDNQQQESQEKQQNSSSNKDSNQGNVKVEDYFNFSNHKFD